MSKIYRWVPDWIRPPADESASCGLAESRERKEQCNDSRGGCGPEGTTDQKSERPAGLGGPGSSNYDLTPIQSLTSPWTRQSESFSISTLTLTPSTVVSRPFRRYPNPNSGSLRMLITVILRDILTVSQYRFFGTLIAWCKYFWNNKIIIR